MREMDAFEQAYKNGYEAGYAKGKRDAVRHARWVKADDGDGVVCIAEAVGNLYLAMKNAEDTE